MARDGLIVRLPRTLAAGYVMGSSNGQGPQNRDLR